MDQVSVETSTLASLSDRFDLSEYIDILRRRWLAVVAGLVIAFGAAFVWFYVYNSPTYEATAVVRVLNDSADDALDSTSERFRDFDRVMNNEVALAESDIIAEEVSLVLGRDVEISATAERGFDVLRLTATDTDPEEAAVTANAFAETFIEVRKRLATEDYRSAASVVARQVEEVGQQIDELADQPDQIRELESLLAQREGLIEKRQELELNAEVGQGGASQLLTPASEPSSPASPKLFRDGLMVLVLGLILGVGLAFMLEHLSDDIRTVDDLEIRAGAPSLSVIPVVGRREQQHLLVSNGDGLLAEPVNSLRISIDVLLADDDERVIAVTSAEPGAGKSTVASHLATSIAHAGRSVALLDADLLRPRVHEVFGIRRSPGLTDIVEGSAALADATVRLPGLPGLLVSPAGSEPGAPDLVLELGLPELIDRYSEVVDAVIVDCPPVLPVAATLSVARRSSGVVLVASSGQSKGAAVAKAADQLRRHDAKVLGTVLNRAPHGSSDVRYYSYGEYRRRPTSKHNGVGQVLGQVSIEPESATNI